MIYYVLIFTVYMALLWPAAQFIGMFLPDGFDYENRGLQVMLALYPIVIPMMLVKWGIEEARHRHDAHR